ncbi:MAG: nicotinate-nucleotide adenylyltransferase [Acidobacteriota bacterium]
MSPGTRIGLLGGTLDPIHLGHVDAALAARTALGLNRVIVLPSRVPPHRPQQPSASPYHRFAMTALAVNGVEGLEASDIELSAPGPSYTADTLARFQQCSGLSPSQIFFITGADAFAEIETWHRYPDVLDLSHFVVVSRPGFPAATVRHRLPLLAPRMTDSADAPFPAIFLVDAPTRDVSSTEIRRRRRAGEPLTGLVAASVEQHIVQHGLYVDDTAPTSISTSSRRADHLHGQD